MKPPDAARLILLAAIWGASFYFIKIGLEAFTPLQIVAGRLGIGAATLYVLLRARGLGLPRDRTILSRLLLMAGMANVLPFLLITWGEESISSSLAAILNSTTPLFTVAIAALFLPGERAGVVRSAGVVLGFVGVGVIVGIDAGGSLAGELAVVAASASYGVGFVYAKRHITGRAAGALQLSAAQLLLAFAIDAPIVLIESFSSGPSFQAGPVAAVGTLGLLGTGIAYVLYYRLVHDVGATTASFVTYLIPVFGVVLGWALLDERLGWNVFAGALLVIAGIAIAERGALGRPQTDLGPVEQAATAGGENPS